MQIDGKVIGQGVYTIAEIGHNHGGDVKLCKQLFLEARNAGADAVKLQKRDNRFIFTKALFNAPYDNENSYGKTYGEHREALEFTIHQFAELQDYAHEIGITFFATAFDIHSVDVLYSLDMPAIKIASADLTNTPLIEYAAQTGLSLIISTGGGSWNDIDRVYNLLNGKVDFALLHCTATYPTSPVDVNLNAIAEMKYRYNCPIGYSSHLDGIYDAQPAFYHGACIIEKHFTLSRSLKGTDHAFSLTPQGFKEMVHYLKLTTDMFGNGEKKQLDAEKKPLQKMSKSLWPAQTLTAGTILSMDNVNIKSPGLGLPPYKLNEVLGKPLIHDVSTAMPLREEDYE